MWLKVGDIAEREGISVMTARRHIKAGLYGNYHITPGGHIRVWVNTGEPEVTLYCRVSTSKQRSSLETQASILKELRPEGKIVNDIGSGYNFERRGFKTILERSLRGIPQIIVATSQDRITEVGFPFIKKIIELSGGSIILHEKDEESEDFSTEELISFITSYINSYYGKRSAKCRKETNSN